MIVEISVTTVVTVIGAFIVAMGIPSAITGVCVSRLEKKIEKREKAREAKDEARRKNELMIIEGMNAAIALGEATARAVQRIPDAQ